MPSCGRRYKPDHGHHYFCHEFCYREALTLYAGSDFPLRSDGSDLMARDLIAGLWNPLYYYRVPGKRYTLEHRRTLKPVSINDPTYWNAAK